MKNKSRLSHNFIANYTQCKKKKKEARPRNVRKKGRLEIKQSFAASFPDAWPPYQAPFS